MTVSKVEVFWSPSSKDKFVTWGAEVSFYQIEELNRNTVHNNKPPRFQLSETTGANLIGTIPEVVYAKCLAWYPVPDPEGLVAIGQANGRILLTALSDTNDTQNLVGREYLPRHNRPCNTLEWSKIEPCFLAAGYERQRSDYALLVWDISGSSSDTKPSVEAGLGDTCHSLAWSSHSRTLVTGFNTKQLRIYDTRDISKPQAFTSSKAVYGIVVDTNFEQRVASYGDSVVCIWDLRNFEKPLLSLPQSKAVTRLGWCPTRSNLISVANKDSAVLNLYDLQFSRSSNGDEDEPNVIERGVIVADQDNLLSYSWHPTIENRILAITASGVLKDLNIVDRITLNWSPTSTLVWNYGKSTLTYIDESDAVYSEFEDISVLMRKRALDGYGIKQKPDFGPQSDLMRDTATKGLWQWIDVCRKLAAEESNKGITPVPFQGVRSALKVDAGFLELKSDMVFLHWQTTEGAKLSPVKVYRCPERSHALRLCGWPYDKDASTLGSILDKLEAQGAVGRATALAVFHLRIRKAIKCLVKAGQGNSSYQLVVMALAGFTDDRSTLWQEMCATQRANITDPYLRAVFAFLTAQPDKYDAVLNESGISTRDKVAFACTYLSDSSLVDFLDKLSKQLMEEGVLDGLLLTGLTNDGINLLQSYVDKTGDIQTVSLLSLYTQASEASKDIRMLQWVHCYRSLLDTWRLWTQRAQFDVLLSQNAHACGVSNEKPPQQVFVSCNFCGKSISVYMSGKGKGTLTRNSNANKQKMSACPSCRKPLPRCAICLVHIGTHPASFGGGSLPLPPSFSSFQDGNYTGGIEPGWTNGETKMSQLSAWITWCQTCRHGGHASHLLHWFTEHSECPVTGCSCKCLNQDAVGQHLSITKHGQD